VPIFSASTLSLGKPGYGFAGCETDIPTVHLPALPTLDRVMDIFSPLSCLPFFRKADMGHGFFSSIANPHSPTPLSTPCVEKIGSLP
jgi:hypothetical protein